MKMQRLFIYSFLLLFYSLSLSAQVSNPGKHFHNKWRDSNASISMELYQIDNSVKVLNFETSGYVNGNTAVITLNWGKMTLILNGSGTTMSVKRNYFPSEIQKLIAQNTNRKISEVKKPEIDAWKASNLNNFYEGTFVLVPEPTNNYNDKDKDGITDKYDLDNNTPQGYTYTNGNVDLRGRHIQNSNGKKDKPNLNINIVSTSAYKPGIIKPEENPSTKKPYIGIAMDGISTIRFDIEIENVSEVKYALPPNSGNLRLTDGTNKNDQKILDGKIQLTNGKAVVYYHPPMYVDRNRLVIPKELTSFDRSFHGMDVPIFFSYEDAKGKQYFNYSLIAFNPTVFLIHGFTGDTSTWEELGKRLKIEKYPFHNGYYYNSRTTSNGETQDVHAQSLLLEENIRLEKMYFEKWGYKVTKFDAVCHSMGGLIARHYMNDQSFTKDIKKIIMVGTPNHGIKSEVDLNLGHIAAFRSKTHEGMAKDVDDESEFMRKLNKGENTGQHLNPDVQYANIYVYPHDLVTTSSSAYLNGVKSLMLFGYVHSTALKANKTVQSITDDTEKVFPKILEWLNSDIPRSPLENMSAQIIQGLGDIYTKNIWEEGGFKKQDNKKIPIDIDQDTYVKTSDNSEHVVIYFYLTDYRTSKKLPWGRIDLDKNSEIRIENFSPNLTQIEMIKGRGKFITRINNGSELGHFMVDIYGGQNQKPKWWYFNPKATIVGLNTDFIVKNENDLIKIDCLEGKVNIVEGTTLKQETISENNAIEISNTNLLNVPVEKDIWWSKEEFDTPKSDNNLFTINKTNPFNIKSSGSSSGTSFSPEINFSWSPDGEFNTSLSGNKASYGYHSLSSKCNLPNITQPIPLTVTWYFNGQLLSRVNYNVYPGQDNFYDNISTNGEPLNPGNYSIEFNLNGNPLGKNSMEIIQPAKLNYEESGQTYLASLEKMQSALYNMDNGDPISAGNYAELAIQGLEKVLYSTPELDDIQAVTEMCRALIALKNMTQSANNNNESETIDFAKISYGHATRANRLVNDLQFKITTQNLVQNLESILPELKK